MFFAISFNSLTRYSINLSHLPPKSPREQRCQYFLSYTLCTTYNCRFSLSSRKEISSIKFDAGLIQVILLFLRALSIQNVSWRFSIVRRWNVRHGGKTIVPIPVVDGAAATARNDFSWGPFCIVAVVTMIVVMMAMTMFVVYIFSTIKHWIAIPPFQGLWIRVSCRINVRRMELSWDPCLRMFFFLLLGFALLPIIRR